tara:strand:+ start:748 stop:1524 length:777 start_codon:yes stop_codon:yes gene_type:complete
MVDEVVEVILDTETTGLDPHECQIVSIGYAFIGPDRNGVFSGNVMIRPDMERVRSQNQASLEEALHITGMTLDAIENHDTPYWRAITELRMNVRRDLRRAGFEDSDYGGYYLRNVRFLFYNRTFDYGFLTQLPGACEIEPQMPYRIYNESYCENYRKHEGKQDDCDCRTTTACIMLRSSEQWSSWSDYHGGYRWIKLVHAYSRVPEEWKVQLFNGHGKRNEKEILELSSRFLDNAHNSEADSVMALIVHDYLMSRGDD